MIAKCFVVLLIVLSFYQEIFSQDLFISNLDSKCLRCLCIASSNCDLKFGCQNGFCGPYLISSAYYADATRDTDIPESTKDFKECAKKYDCAKKIVKSYVARFARDCNKDGVTDCTDYAMINFNGGYGCELDLFRSTHSRQYAERYYNCSL